jgi:hypothetical protein
MSDIHRTARRFNACRLFYFQPVLRLSHHIPIVSATRTIIRIITTTNAPFFNDDDLGSVTVGCFFTGRTK